MAITTWQHHKRMKGSTPIKEQVAGWTETLKRVKKELKHAHLSMVAAAMAYYMLFALIPAMTSVVLIYAWVSDPDEITMQMQSMKEIIPEQIQPIITGQLTSLANNTTSTLGLSAFIALFIAIYSASKGTRAFMDALNMINEREESRGIFKSTSLSMGMALLGAVIGVIAISVVVALPPILGFIKLGPVTNILTTAASWFILLWMFSFFLSFAYHFGPDLEKTKWKWITVGAVIASVLWAVTSGLFSFYAKEFGNFNKTYGSLGAMIVLMLWFYISSFVILLGAEINAARDYVKREKGKEPEKRRPFKGVNL